MRCHSAPPRALLAWLLAAALLAACAPAALAQCDPGRSIWHGHRLASGTGIDSNSSACGPGYYALLSGATTCLPCPVGTTIRALRACGITRAAGGKVLWPSLLLSLVRLRHFHAALRCVLLTLLLAAAVFAARVPAAHARTWSRVQFVSDSFHTYAPLHFRGQKGSRFYQRVVLHARFSYARSCLLTGLVLFWTPAVLSTTGVPALISLPAVAHRLVADASFVSGTVVSDAVNAASSPWSATLDKASILDAVGHAFVFDGAFSTSGLITVGNIAVGSALNGVSFAFWFREDNALSNPAPRVPLIYARSTAPVDTTYPGFIYIDTCGSNHLGVLVDRWEKLSTPAGDYNLDYMDDIASAYAFGDWVHYTVTLKPSSGTTPATAIYMDGLRKDKPWQPKVQNITGSTMYLTLGGVGTSTGNTIPGFYNRYIQGKTGVVKGALADLQVYNYVLNATEIQTLAQSCMGGSSPPAGSFYAPGCTTETCSEPTANQYVYRICGAVANTVLSPIVGCDVGYYQSTAAVSGSSTTLGTAPVCTGCATGKYQNVSGNFGGSSSCITCTANPSPPSGYYVARLCNRTTDTLLAAVTVTSCTSGNYLTAAVPGSSASLGSDGRCTACSEPSTGYFVTTACTTTANTVLSSATSSCNAGFYLSRALVRGNSSSAGVNGQCSPCNSGTYQSANGNAAGSASCITCTVPNPGQYVSVACTTNADTTLATPTLVPCAMGRYLVNYTQGNVLSRGSDYSCNQCAAGTYQNVSSNVGFISSCTTCALGSYSFAAGATTCSSCPPGSTTAATGAATLSSCLALPGYYVAVVNATSLCPANSYCAGGVSVSTVSAPAACPANTVLAAPADGASAATGNNDITDCVVAAGYYVTAGTPNLATTCPAGNFCLGGGNIGTPGGATPCPTGSNVNSTGSALLTACIVQPGFYIDGSGPNVPANCTAGSFCTGGGAVGTVGGITGCSAGKANPNTGSTSASACVTCNAGTFALAGSATCTPCAPGYTSGSMSGSCPSLCVFPSAPASCSGVYTFNQTHTTGCHFGSYANLGGSGWTDGTSTCTDCPAGTVSPGWPGSVANSSACINTTLTITALSCIGSTVNATFGGGESLAGIAPTNSSGDSDIPEAQLEVDNDPAVAGSLASCTANSTAGGVFTCNGLVPDDGYKCATNGAAPVASITGETASFTCTGVGPGVKAVFQNAQYSSGSFIQASTADLAYVDGYTLPANVNTSVGAFAPDPSSGTPLDGYCYVDAAASTLTCYGFTPANGYECATANSPPGACQPGTFSNAAVNGSLAACQTCQATTYSDATSCISCPTGSSSAAGSSALAQCTLLPGFFIAAGSLSTPVLCISNSYCPGGGAVGTAGGAMVCPAGYSLPPPTTAGAAATGNNDVSDCVAPPPLPPPPAATFRPPLPPRPPPPAQAGYSVTTTSRLDGVLPEHFDDPRNYTYFTNALAASVGTVPAAVDIISAGLPTRRRGLQQTAGLAAQVSYVVLTATAADAQRVSADATNTTRFLAELQAANLTDVTGVTLVSAPVTVLVPATPTGAAPAVPIINSITVTPLVTVQGGGSFVNPASAVSLAPDVTSTAAASLVYVWSQFSGPALNLSDPAVVSGSRNTRVLALFPGALAPSSVYQFSLSVSDAVGRAVPARVRVVTMALPYNGTLSVSPSAGVNALNTALTLTTGNWYDGNANGTYSHNCLSLQYAFAYSLSTSGVDGDLVWLSVYGNATTLTGALLPAGNVTLQVFAMNSLGATSALPAVMLLQVAATAFSSVNVTQLLAPAGAALQPVELTARLMTVTTSLNNAPSAYPNPADVAASVQLRTSLVSFLLNLSSPAASGAASPLQNFPPSVVQNIAVSTAALVAPTTQVSQACSDAALQVLGNVSSLTNLTPETVNAIAAGLSSMAMVADELLTNSGVGSASGAALQQLRLGIVNVVSVLSASLLTSLSTPGAAPIVISSPSVSIYLALDDSAGDSGSSRLFNQPITAGGQSAFAPLPPDVFAAVPPSSVAGGVRTALAAFSFDPYATLAKMTVQLSGYTALGDTEQALVLKALAAAANRGLGVSAVQATNGIGLSKVSGASSVTLNVQLELPANASSAVTAALLGVNSADAQAYGLSLATGFAVSNVTFGTPGFTRLEFSTRAGTPVAMANLSAPVTFTLPSLPALVSGVKAQCQWYDSSAQAYSTVGCVSLPDPLPAGHTVAWVAGFTAARDADMMRAWTITGPLAANCSLQVMDCTTQPPPPPVYPNPLRPFDVAQVACDTSGVNKEPKRVITGSRCALIEEDNTYGCYWNNSKQAFVGAGCVASGGPVRCACRHLTDFAGASKPSIPTASLQDLLSLNPADIVTKLKYLFIVVIVLFGCMWIGAAFGYGQDAKMRASILHKLQEPRMGFQMTEEGAWLWRFHLEPIETDLAVPTGPAVELAKLFGMPLARLRAALPDELLEHTLAETLGRRYGLSASGMEESLETQMDLTRRLSAVLGRASGKLQKAHSGHTNHSAHDGHKSKASAKDETGPLLAGARQELELMVGTALVLAFIQVGQLMPVVDLMRRISAAAARFDNLLTPAGWDFSKTQTDFVRARRRCSA